MWIVLFGRNLVLSSVLNTWFAYLVRLISAHALVIGFKPGTADITSPFTAFLLSIFNARTSEPIRSLPAADLLPHACLSQLSAGVAYPLASAREGR